MIQGYEWVFIICYASVGYGAVLLVCEMYMALKGKRFPPDARPPRSAAGPGSRRVKTRPRLRQRIS